MANHRVVVVVCTIMCSMTCGQLADAAPIEQWNTFASQGGEENGRYYSIGCRKFLNSFTSYQFPNPFVPEADPLSRLEFPIDQWFVGFKGGYRARGWSLDGQAWINANRESRAFMQDSDWDDENMPKQKTVFSESRCRLNKGLLFDVAARLDLPLDLLASLGTLSGVLGWRYEHFFFTTHDGVQEVFGDGASVLAGDGIDFMQDFYHTYCGINGRGSFDLGRLARMLPLVSFEVQIDYGFVKARNEDLHLLREGHRVTTQNTRGHCWHGAFLVEFVTLSDVRTVVEIDFRRSLTRGNHRLINGIFDLDFSFEGSRVWSDLVALSLTGELRF